MEKAIRRVTTFAHACFSVTWSTIHRSGAVILHDQLARIASTSPRNCATFSSACSFFRMAKGEAISSSQPAARSKTFTGAANAGNSSLTFSPFLVPPPVSPARGPQTDWGEPVQVHDERAVF